MWKFILCNSITIREGWDFIPAPTKNFYGPIIFSRPDSGYAKCPKGHFRCIRDLKMEEIVVAVEGMMGGNR